MKCSNLYIIRKWYLFYSSQIDFLYQAGTKLQKVDNITNPNANERTLLEIKQKASDKE